jgi:hypothetical protein
MNAKLFLPSSNSIITVSQRNEYISRTSGSLESHAVSYGSADNIELCCQIKQEDVNDATSLPICRRHRANRE